MLLVGTDSNRRKILAARHIEPGIVESMRSPLDLPVDDLEEAEAGPVAPPSTRRSRGTNLGPSGPVDHDQADKKVRDIGRRGDIEVKSTTGDDPTAPFLISQSELVEALRRRESYFIYRVTDVESAARRWRSRCRRSGAPPIRRVTLGSRRRFRALRDEGPGPRKRT